MGWIENVYVEDITAKLKAKLDTGATTSSMRAEVLKILKPKPPAKRHTVVFQVQNNDGRISTFERKLVRWVRIKDKNGTLQRRPTVKMEFCVGGRRIESDVNLSARTDMLYPVLVGRNMLSHGGIIVDANRTFTASARCAEPAHDFSKED